MGIFEANRFGDDTAVNRKITPAEFAEKGAKGDLIRETNRAERLSCSYTVFYINQIAKWSSDLGFKLKTWLRYNWTPISGQYEDGGAY